MTPIGKSAGGAAAAKPIFEQKYTRPANANELVVAKLKTTDPANLKQVDLALRDWGFTGAKATDPAVQKLVSTLGSMTPGKDAAVKDALTHLKNNALSPTDTNALMDAVRMVRIKNFIATADLGR